VAIYAASVLIFAVLLRTGEWFVPISPGTVWNAVQAERLADIINASFQIGFFVVAIISAVEALRELHRLNVRRQTAERATCYVLSATCYTSRVPAAVMPRITRPGH
jgi:hypothetical protein